MKPESHVTQAKGFANGFLLERNGFGVGTAHWAQFNTGHFVRVSYCQDNLAQADREM
jgi:hypothetical protein